MDKKNTTLSKKEKFLCIIVGFFTWFIGGFIMAQVYRSKGYTTKARQSSKFFLLGIGLSLIYLMAFWVFSINNAPKAPVTIEDINFQLPAIDEERGLEILRGN